MNTLTLSALQLVTLSLSATALAQSTTPAADPPQTWIDPDTGHRIHRLTSEPNSTGFYFNINAFTPDHKTMVYTAPDGIHTLNLATKQTRLLVPGTNLKAIVVGHKTNTLFFINNDQHTLHSVNTDTADTKKLADLPPRATVTAVNADETLAAGTFIEGDGKDYGQERVNPAGMSGPLVQPVNKGQMMEERLAAKLPMTLFTIDLQNGKQTPLLQHNTNWLNHLLFSPADPTLLMYCHEGPWQKVDRIWTIHTDGTANTQIHTRTMAMEIFGHEFWGLDGKTIWYDLHIPKGEDFFLASYNLETKERRWFHMQRNEWSIHFNVTADESLMCGDGGDPGQVAKAPDGQWIYLFHPQLIRNTGMDDPAFIRPGILKSERLVNMSKHNYKLEPNVRFSPDNKQIFFTANFLGPSYVFAVDVAREATPSAAPH
jgi:oligogalacturonide lyase